VLSSPIVHLVSPSIAQPTFPSIVWGMTYSCSYFYPGPP